MEKHARYTLVGLVIASVLIIAFAGSCGQNDSGEENGGTRPSSAPSGGDETFTAEELAKYDGRNGRPAYVAVDGVVYNVTGSSQWAEGRHAVCQLESSAGGDLSEEMAKAPSGMRAMLERFPVVGRME